MTTVMQRIGWSAVLSILAGCTSAPNATSSSDTAMLAEAQPPVAAAAKVPEPRIAIEAAALECALIREYRAPFSNGPLLVVDAAEDSAAVVEQLSAWPLMTKAAAPPLEADGALHCRVSGTTRTAINWIVSARDLGSGQATARVTCIQGGRAGWGADLALRLGNDRWMVVQFTVNMWM